MVLVLAAVMLLAILWATRDIKTTDDAMRELLDRMEARYLPISSTTTSSYWAKVRAVSTLHLGGHTSSYFQGLSDGHDSQTHLYE